MTYGFQSINDNSIVQIDSEAPRLCMLTKGTYSGTGTASGVFARPITSQDPPMVFIRPDQTAQIQVPYAVWFTGGPGNWTGFSMSASVVYNALSGLYFVAAWASMGTSQFGMRLWDPAATLIYDSGAPAVVVTYASGSWTYLGSEQLSNAKRYKWGINKMLGAGEYVSLNPFTMNCHTSGSGGGCSLGVDYAAGRIMMYSVSFEAWTDQGHRPFLCAKLLA